MVPKLANLAPRVNKDLVLEAKPNTCPVAVVITSHNYGEYLAGAIESVLNQTIKPAEIVVVDDASEDNTREVAAKYANRGVKYIRVEYRNTLATRAEGYRRTKSPILCFLDADDRLSQDYLASGLPFFNDPKVGVVYCDVLYRKPDGEFLIRHPDVIVNLDLVNHCGPSSLVRRDCLDQTDVMNSDIPHMCHEDWFVWRTIFRAGWLFRKQRGILIQIRHGDGKLLKAIQKPFRLQLAIDHEPITLCLPLSGRSRLLFEHKQLLDNLTIGPDRLHLLIYDSSGNDLFSTVAKKTFGSVNCASFKYIKVKPVEFGLADKEREGNKEVFKKVVLATARIYNRLHLDADTEYVAILEDDVLPDSPDFLDRLLDGFGARVGSVAAPYRCAAIDAYNVWKRERDKLHFIKERGKGLSVVDGCGFGCTVIRKSLLSMIRFHNTQKGEKYGCDVQFYDWLATTNYRALVNWDVGCEHFTEGRR